MDNKKINKTPPVPPQALLLRTDLCTLAFAVPLFGGLYSIKNETADSMVFSWSFILAVWLCIFFSKTLSPVIIHSLRGDSYKINNSNNNDKLIINNNGAVIAKAACIIGVVCGIASFLLLKRGVGNIISSMVALFSSLLSLCTFMQSPYTATTKSLKYTLLWYLFITIHITTTFESYHQYNDQTLLFSVTPATNIHHISIPPNNTLYTTHGNNSYHVVGGVHKRTFGMYFECFGDGDKTIVMDSGMPFHASAWTVAIPQILEAFAHTKVCVYDRFGYARSDAIPTPRNSVNMGIELHEVLHSASANISVPYTLVGWSFGGLNVQVYKALFPLEVSGMVVLDSLTKDSLRNEKGFEDEIEYGKLMFQLSEVLSPFGFMRIFGTFGVLPTECGYPTHNRLPVEVNRVMEAVFLNKKFYENAYNELDGLADSFAQAQRLIIIEPNLPPFGDMPLVVVSSHQPPNQNWSVMSSKFTLLSTHSDHYIPYNDVQIIITALKTLL